jgi:hypothetical protein
MHSNCLQQCHTLQYRLVYVQLKTSINLAIHAPNSTSRVTSQPNRILNTMRGANPEPTRTPRINATEVALISIKLGMSTHRRIVVIVPELPSVDIAALTTQVVEKALAPVVVPGAPRVDVDLAVGVRVVAPAVTERALRPVGALFELVRGGAGVGEGFWLGLGRGGGRGCGCGGYREEVECWLDELHFWWTTKRVRLRFKFGFGLDHTLF